MSKIETVKALNDSGPQLQVVESVQSLKRQISSLPEILRELTQENLVELAGLAGRMDTSMSALVKAMDAVLIDTREKAESTKRSFQAQEKALTASTKKTVEATKAAIEAAQESLKAAEESRPRWWRSLALAMLAGVISATIALTGAEAFDRLLPPAEVRASARHMAEIWAKATPKEQELIKKIYARPRK
jgi:ElaB/YqjD/DUF883 family membrane-anchored ribosome-binding protein